jgi:nitrogen fixation/metabolism regulation signal transduction histidine kinase
MWIKTKLLINTIVPMILVFILLLSFFITSNIVKKSEEEHSLASSINHGIFELNILLNDYLLYREERAVKQWETKYSSGLSRLQKSVKEEPNQELIKSMLSDYLILEKLFKEEVENYRSEQILIEEGASEEELFLVRSLQKRKISQLSITSQSIVSSANILEYKSHSNLNSTYDLNRKWNLLTLATLFIITSLISIKVSRDISKSLLNLRNAITKIKKGKLGTKINVESKDEFGEITKSFNDMSTALHKKSHDLERFAKIAVGREEKIIELKKKLAKNKK